MEVRSTLLLAVRKGKVVEKVRLGSSFVSLYRSDVESGQFFCAGGQSGWRPAGVDWPKPTKEGLAKAD